MNEELLSIIPNTENIIKLKFSFDQFFFKTIRKDVKFSDVLKELGALINVGYLVLYLITAVF